MQTLVTEAFGSPQNLKCPSVSIFHNRLFNPDSVHGLLGNSATNYPFFCLDSLIRTRSSAENTILLLFTSLFRLIASDRATAVCNAILVTEIYFVIDIHSLITPLENNILKRNWVISLAIYCAINVRNFI